MYVKLIAKTNTDGLSITEFLAGIARRCYSIKSWEHIKDTVQGKCKVGEKNIDAEKLMKRIISSEHFSILEHVVFTFSIEGIAQYTLGQLTRHRMASFAATSFRYNNLKKADEINFSLNFDNTTEIGGKISGILNESIKHYNNLIDKGLTPEQARVVLPQSIQTNVIMTMNLRELFHFLDLRNCQYADKEIHTLAQEIYKLCKKEDGYIFSFAKGSCFDCKKKNTCDKVRK